MRQDWMRLFLCGGESVTSRLALQDSQAKREQCGSSLNGQLKSELRTWLENSIENLIIEAATTGSNVNISCVKALLISREVLTERMAILKNKKYEIEVMDKIYAFQNNEEEFCKK